MTISMYQASVPVFVARLTALAKILKLAEANAAERKIDPQVFLTARLAPDMLHFTRQVQVSTDHAKGASARLSGKDNPRFEDNEQSFADLEARIARTLDFLGAIKPQEIDGSEEKTISLTVGGHPMSFPGLQYLLHFAIPNFYFHLTTAYDILRHNGVPLGKVDFMGARR